ncbi:hypothetical protein GCM10027566_34890 [Arachidicoccus ginsenosidivorans]|uniref:SprT family zinc-dependent metalloprotease n=1 Tax=Arachidicoccus ginsenosidivorans TaxID=496057 RepID=A0A5B8VL39_9BACT|nr:SprT family zinc-dependent metalloprotease [Arachidicoccus ginsenosidivorans]QEC71682.1 SprT family zinc-dependent metalloprotease [Arachidicoccus ginsenosidivorans]
MLQNGKSKIHNIRISSADAGKPHFKNFSIKRTSNREGGNGSIMVAQPNPEIPTPSCTTYFYSYWIQYDPIEFYDGSIMVISSQFVSGSYTICDDGGIPPGWNPPNDNPLPSGGGNGGIGGSPYPPKLDLPELPPYIVDSIYIDSSIINSPCMDSALTKVLNSRDSIAFLIHNTFGGSGYLNLTFMKAQTLLSDKGNAIPGQTRYSNNGKEDTILLNYSQLAGSSQEYVAGVIIHEMVHAFLDQKNDSLLKEQTQQHSEIALHYVDQMANLLINIFPNLPLSDAQALSIDGLSDITYPLTFQELLTQYGFNSNENSTESIGYHTMPYSVPGGYKGTRCN